MTAVPSRVTPASATAPVAARVREVGVWALVAGVVLIFAAGMVAGLVLGPAATRVVLWSWDPAAVQQILATWGLPDGSVVAYALMLDLVTFALGLVAAWVLLRRPRSGFRVYVAIVLLLHVAVGGNATLLLAAAIPSLGWLTGLTGLGWFGLFSLLLVFPDGRFVPRWTRWTVPAWIAVFLWFLSLDAYASPAAAPATALLVLLVTGVVAQVHRYRRHLDAVTRRQTRWVLAAFAARAGLVIAVGLVKLVGPDSEPSAAALVLELVGIGLSYLVSALVVLAIALAVVRHRLFDTDVVVTRAVVYTTLTVFVLVVYGAVVGLVGLLWPAGGIVLPVLATAVAAVTLVPVRSWLQLWVRRLVYGERAEPYLVITALSDQLSTAVRPEELVQAVVTTIGPALGLRRAAIVLEGEAMPVAVDQGGTGTAIGDAAETYPIDHRGRTVGRLDVTEDPSSPLTPEDRELLRRVADQAGLAVAAAQTSAELRTARDETVAAREQERRRLHRDLHDGLGPTLASLYQRVDLAERLVTTDPDASRRLLAASSVQIRETVAEVRRLVYALRPPRLDDLGLIEALRLACAELSSDGLRIEVRTLQPLTDLPPAIESTAYRIALEAVTNTVRHAHAGLCTVEVTAVDGVLVVSVGDDGQGLPSDVSYGAGVRSMRERAGEVGGSLDLEPMPPHGTVVIARLPLPGPA